MIIPNYTYCNWSCRSTIALCCGNMRPLRLVSAYISYYISFFNEMTRVLMKQFPDMVNPGMTMYDPFICKKVWNRILSFILSTKYWLFIKWVPNTPEPIWMWLWFNNQRVWLPKQRHGLNIHEPYVQEVFKIGCTHCMCRVFCGNVYIYIMWNIVWYWILKKQRMQIRIEKNKLSSSQIDCCDFMKCTFAFGTSGLYGKMVAQAIS